ncbi:hypothetical protein V6N12_016709 [Hibiscus sabdariffa]|uniref:RNase H type-1 domain-containing protein n=1 Tax=Hibiscus sabdariffa TaxID=183260 RepID=A0ABR2CG49_9ROSI
MAIALSLSSAFAAEALAGVHGLQFALDIKFNRVILESDSRSTILKLNSNENEVSDHMQWLRLVGRSNKMSFGTMTYHLWYCNGCR